MTQLCVLRAPTPTQAQPHAPPFQRAMPRLSPGVLTDASQLRINLVTSNVSGSSMLLIETTQKPQSSSVQTHTAWSSLPTPLTSQQKRKREAGTGERPRC